MKLRRERVSEWINKIDDFDRLHIHMPLSTAINFHRSENKFNFVFHEFIHPHLIFSSFLSVSAAAHAIPRKSGIYATFYHHHHNARVYISAAEMR
jgi:hypothetical protein